MKPILDRYASAIEAKKDSEEKFVADLDGVLDTTVFSRGAATGILTPRDAMLPPGRALPLASGAPRSSPSGMTFR